jgi:crossover junction endodeoxyribonuclease RuvC
MKILSIDPGSNLGYAKFKSRNDFESGELTTNPKQSQLGRMCHLWDQMQVLFSEFEPNVLVIEDVLKAAYGLKHYNALFWLIVTYTCAVLTAYRRQMRIVNIPPAQLKKTITGKGNAKKDQILAAINKLTGLGLKKNKHNQADAIGLGITFYEIGG